VFCDAAQEPKLRELADAAPRPWQVVTTAAGSAFALTLDDLPPAPPVTRAEAVGGEGAIVQIYTSGTTGDPKGVVVPLRALASFHAYLEYGLDVREDDVFWNAADPGWAYGLYFGVLAPLAAGARSLMLGAGFSPELALEVLERFAVTNFAAAPTAYRAIRASGREPRRPLVLRTASSAGEPLTPDVNGWARDALGVQVRDHYGQTETGMLVNNHQHPALREAIRPGSMGKPMPGWTVTILGQDETPAAADELGRVAVDLPRSPLAWFAGYAGAPASAAGKFSADGRWYFTGDMGRLDEDGYVYFTARDDDVIIMAGYRIGPFEIESVIAAHEAVAECAVIATPDEVRGELLQAVVVLRPGFGPSEDLAHDLQAWVKQRYAAHAYPRQVHFAPSLPKTPSGKVQRNLIRQQLMARA
jgi:acetyl-CoA synthetase